MKTRTVLLVEDEANFSELMRRALEGAGFDVLQAFDGAQGLLMAPSADLIVLDLLLPKVSGEEVLRDLRESLGPIVPVIVITGADIGDVPNRVRPNDLTQFMRKPFEMTDLVAGVRKGCGVCENVDTVIESGEKIKEFIDRQNQITDTGFWRAQG